MTLVLVLLAGVALAGIAGRSLRSALHTRTQVEHLQRRWAIMSLQTTLAGRIEELLEEAQRGQAIAAQPGQRQRYDRPPISELRLVLTLGEQDYELVLTDEQAKLNVNQLLEDHSTARITSWLRRTIQGIPVGPGIPGVPGGEAERTIHVLPLPMPSQEVSPGALPRLGAYGQLFPHARPQTLIGERTGQGLVRDITCWGDGRIHLHRASDRVLEQRLESFLSSRQLQELLEARQKDPYLPPSELLKAISDLDQATRRQLEERLTDRSAVFGLWIIAHAPQRRWYNLQIVSGGQVTMDETSGGPQTKQPAQRYDFSW